jgi:hypothetical protein
MTEKEGDPISLLMKKIGLWLLLTEKEGDPISLLMEKIGPRLLLCSPSGGVYRQEKMGGMIALMSAADGKLQYALSLFLFRCVD